MRLRLMLVSFLMASVSLANAGTITISDGIFDLNEWAHDTSGKSGGSGNSVIVSQFPAGGSPGQFRRHRNVSTVGGFNPKVTNSWNFYTARPYSPAVEGAIVSLDYSEESLAIQGGTQSGTIALRQNGFFYRPLPTFTTTSSTTVWESSSVDGVTASDFSLYFFDSVAGQWLFVPTANPDFSSVGGEIEFGYFRGNNAGNHKIYDVSAGIDNWTVELTTAEIPEPTSFSIAICATGVMLGMRGKRKG